ncbi:hypothetical protein [Aquimarina sp. AU474]|uniref:hypothetical protein n=1 Tax=Aquimarina sp. AU474 TaxID=2108529 RepID=UPI000D699D4A|nr:hypothetical protein [Aquimarina sp. AU474]
MDELELLKQDWKKQNEGLPKLSYNEIYQMILKKSSSMVKWIFIISLLEFALWIFLDIALRLNGFAGEEVLEEANIKSITVILSVLYYSIIVFFIVRFYLNYKKIQTTDSAKVLMKNILKTRKTVKYYVWFNIGFFMVTLVSLITYLAFFTTFYQQQGDLEAVPIKVIVISAILSGLVFVGFIALFYRLIYGILTRRLKRNYTELEKLEV